MSQVIKQAVHPGGKNTATGAYSPGIVAGDMVFVSGQGPLDPQTSQVVQGTIEEQTALTMRNVQSVLAAAGCTLDDCVKMTVHLADINDFARFNEIYAGFFKGPRPARTTVQSGLLDIRVEIDAIAVKGAGAAAR